MTPAAVKATRRSFDGRDICDFGWVGTAGLADGTAASSVLRAQHEKRCVAGANAVAGSSSDMRARQDAPKRARSRLRGKVPAWWSATEPAGTGSGTHRRA